MSTADNDRSKPAAGITSTNSSSNLSGLRNKIKIRLSSASSTADVTSSCVEPPAAVQSSSVTSHQGPGRCTAVARNLTFNFSRRGRHAAGSPSRRPLSVVQSSHLTLVDFVDLFRSFMLHARKDLRDLFDQQLATATTSATNELLTPTTAGGSTWPAAAAASSFPSCPVNSKLLLY